MIFLCNSYFSNKPYTITDKKGIAKDTHYRTSFKFKIRNANCMVYIFDAKSGEELSNGDVTENGFRIDTAKSSYPKLQVKKEILNNTKNGLMEDTRFNGAATDGETFTGEGIYIVKAYNRYDDKLEPAIKTIYVGSNNILAAYVKHCNSSEQYTISQLNDMINEGYTITDSGDIIEPVTETTTTSSTEITTNKSETTTTVTTTPEIATNDTITSSEKPETKSKPALPIASVIVGMVVVGGIIAFAMKKNKKDK